MSKIEKIAINKNININDIISLLKKKKNLYLLNICMMI